MRKPILLITLGVFVAAMLLFVSGRSPGAITAGPTVDLTGEWGFVYSAGTSTFGDCTSTWTQTGSSLSFTGFECESSGGAPTGTGGTGTGTISGLNVSGEIVFTGPGLGFTVNFGGPVAADGNSMSGTWSSKPSGSSGGTYIASRLIATCASPPCSSEAVTAPNGVTVTFDTVTGTGGTTVISDASSSGTLPGQFVMLDLFFHVLTTATVSGPINICGPYQDKDNDGIVDGTSPPVLETDLRILHNEAGTFVDRTDLAKSDYVNNVICAVVSSLSEFALGSTPPVTPSPTPTPTAITPSPTNTPVVPPTDTPLPPPTVVGGLAVDLNPLAGSGGSAGPLAGTIAGVAALAVMLTGAAWYARRRWLR